LWLSKKFLLKESGMPEKRAATRRGKKKSMRLVFGTDSPSKKHLWRVDRKDKERERGVVPEQNGPSASQRPGWARAVAIMRGRLEGREGVVLFVGWGRKVRDQRS